MLKVNTMLDLIELGGEVQLVFYFFTKPLSTVPKDTSIDGDGMNYIVGALKVNNTLTSIDLQGTYYLLVTHSLNDVLSQYA